MTIISPILITVLIVLDYCFAVISVSAKELLSYGTITSLINKTMNVILDAIFMTERFFENLIQELSLQPLYGIGVFFRVIWIIARRIV